MSPMLITIVSVTVYIALVAVVYTLLQRKRNGLS